MLESNGNTRTHGGHTTEPNALGQPQTASGTLAMHGSASGSGHLANPGGTQSGNFKAGLPGKGHCTGDLQSACATGPASP
jgi:hypothetical protein